MLTSTTWTSRLFTVCDVVNILPQQDTPGRCKTAAWGSIVFIYLLLRQICPVSNLGVFPDFHSYLRFFPLQV